MYHSYILKVARGLPWFVTAVLTLFGNAANAEGCAPTVSPNPVVSGGAYTITANCSGETDPLGYSYNGPTLALGVKNSTATFSVASPSAATQIGPNTINVANANGTSGSVVLNVSAPQCTLSVTPASVLPTQTISISMTCGGSPVAARDNYYYEVPSGIFVPTAYAIPNNFGLGNSVQPNGPAPGTYVFNAYACVPAGTPGSVTRTKFTNGTDVCSGSTALPNGILVSSQSIVVTAAANQAPAVTITAPANNAGFTEPAAINITANATDSDGTIQRVEFFNGTTLLGTATAAPYAFSWTNVAAGTYSITARATDNLNAQTTSAAISVTVNAANLPPTVSLTAPANNATFTAPASITLSANAADSDGTIQRVEFFNGTTLLGTATAAPYAFSWTNVAAGTYSITARATDNLNAQATSAAASITVNAATNQAPTVVISGPPPGPNFTAPAAIALEATANDRDGTVTRVEFFNGETSVGEGVQPTPGSPIWRFSWTNVAAGNYLITAVATDNAGAIASSSPYPIIVDGQAPTVAITAPANNATFISPAAITIAANASDADGTIARVEFYNGAALLGTSTAAPFTFSWNNVTAGTYSITARAVDNANNATTSAAVNVIVNPPANVAPTVAITAPASGTNFTAPASIGLQAAAADGDGTIRRVEFFNGTTLLGTATNEPYTFSWINVAAGSYSVTARATDNSNATTTSAPVTINVQFAAAPVIACSVTVSPAAISVSESSTFRTACTRNGAPLTPGAGETVSYQWIAGAGSPAIPAPPPTDDTLNFPAGFFKKSGNYEYRAIATLTSSQFASPAISNEAAGIVQVTRSASKIEIVTPAAQRKIVPGEPIQIVVLAKDDQGGVPGIPVTWQVRNGNTKNAPKSQRKAGTCPDTDTPTGQTLTTDASGQILVSFTPSCASGGRDISLTAGGVTETLTLSGPNQVVTKVVLMNQGAVVVADAGKLTALPVMVQDSAGAAVSGASTVWEIAPADAGTVTSPAISNAAGEARSILVIKDGVAAATVKACIDQRPDTCVTIPVRSTKLAIAAPAQAMVQPMVRQSVDAPRVQLNNIRNRLERLRVEENNAGGASSKSGSGAVPGITGLGVFMMGDVEIAKRDPSNADKGYKLRTKGVTIGADYRATKDLVVGAAAGVLKGDTTAGEGGTQKSTGVSGSAFAQWLPAANWYTNMILNAGRNKYDSTRTSISGQILKARGVSTQQGLQVEAGYSLAKDGTRLTPFIRYELIRAKLKPFEESGGSDAVAIGGQTVRSNTVGLGAIAEHAISTSNGVWVPSARVEYLRESQSQSEVFARLVNGTPVLVPLNEELIDKSYGTWGLNLQWLSGVGGNLTSSFIGYEQTFGKTGFKNDRFTAGVKIPF
jgi:hypothetical protein